jgi:purine-binding chemotaxis protein CheW
MQPIATLPEVKRYVKGIINLRGEIIPVMDVRLRFGKPEIAYTERTCVIVARTGQLCVGLIVDSVCEVIQIPDESISQPPRINGSSNRFIKSIGKVGQEIKLLLDFEKLVADDELEALSRQEGAFQEAVNDA